MMETDAEKPGAKGNEKKYSVSEEAKVPQPPTVKETLWEFPDYTSTHGWAHVKRHTRWPLRAFWGIVTLTLIGVMLFNVVGTFTTYSEYHYDVLLDVKVTKKLQFPAVTICNLNPYRQTNIHKLAATYALLNDTLTKLNNLTLENAGAYEGSRRKRRSVAPLQPEEKPRTRVKRDDEEYWDEEEDGSGEMNTFLDEFEEQYNDTVYDAYLDELRAYSQERLRLNQKIKTSINLLPEKFRRFLGYPLKSMLLECIYGQQVCSDSNFTLTTSSRFGNCYTFNGVGLDMDPTSTRPGADSGLQLQLFIDLDEYYFKVASEVGMKVLLHDKEDVPQIDSQGILLSPGFITNIGVRLMQLERLGLPHYECVPRSTGGDKNIYHKQYPNGYTIGVCQKSCYQLNVISMCGCADSTLPSDAAHMPTKLRLCNGTDDDCMANIASDYVDELLKCDCPPPCQEIQYEASVSMAEWPPWDSTYMLELAGHYEDSNHPNFVEIMDLQEDYEEWMRNNLVKLNIHFESLNHETINQRPKMDGLGLISNVGGLMGLWVGMSLLTVVEYAELLIHLIIVAVRPRRKLQPQ